MAPADCYGYALTTTPEAAAAYNGGLLDILRLREGALENISQAIVYDPTFALGHAAVALLGYEMSARVDVASRIQRAVALAPRATARERSHVNAIADHIAGDSSSLIEHIRAYPRDALILNSIVPTIAFAGAVEVPEQGWAIVESCTSAYGDDWWFTGLLAFIRQEQHRFDDAMSLSVASLAAEPSAGHSAHARAHAHYETGDHVAGTVWMDEWTAGAGARTESLSHFYWHAALHELSLGNIDSVRRRYETQLQPENLLGCRGMVDSGSLLFRWALTPGAHDVPDIRRVAAHAGQEMLAHPPSPFVALHSAILMLATDDAPALRDLSAWAARHDHPTQREVVAPLAAALAVLASGDASSAADRIAALQPLIRRLGGSDAQREIIEETRIAALLKAGRWDEARIILDARLDRRHSPRDAVWRDSAVGAIPAG